jgi:hypothetical protein
MTRIEKIMPGLLLRGGVWHIDKVLFGKRICESTRTKGSVIKSCWRYCNFRLMPGLTFVKLTVNQEP